VTRDVHKVVDPHQLGGHLPSELLAETPTLSGVVFELTPDGERRPIESAEVQTDGLGGLGWITAGTLTDEEGRYVLCGFQGETSTYVIASKAGFRPLQATTRLTGNTTLDIELTR
jgi:hypothetical protein